MGKQIWTKEKLKNEIIKYYKENGRISQQDNIRLSASAVNYFGSWGNALRECELPLYNRYCKKFTDDMKKESFELGYIIGVLKGDGHITNKKKGNGGHSIVLSVIDKDFADYFANIIYKWSNYHPKRYTINDKFHTKIFYRVYLFDKIINLFFKNYDTNTITNSTKDMKIGFLKGLFDSEGSANNSQLNNPKLAKRRISFCNCNKNIIDIIKILLNDFGIKCSLYRKVGSGFNPNCISYTMEIRGKNNLEWFYNNIGFTIKRKQDKLLVAINSFKPIEKICIYCNKKFNSKPCYVKQLVCKECNKFRIIESNLNWYYNMKDNPQRWEEYIKKRSDNAVKQI